MHDERFILRCRDYAVYLAIRSVVVIVQILGWTTALRLGDWFGWLAHRLSPRHAEVARGNLRVSFPHLDEKAREDLLQKTYLHWGRVLIEMIRLPRVLHPSNLAEHFQYANPGDFARAMSWVLSGRPLVVVTGHFGNFEALNYLLGMFGLRGAVVARKLDNPHLDAFLRSFREKTGQVILDKNHDYPEMVATLERGGWLGMLGDQDAGPRGAFVPFMGRPASTFKSIALLSLEHRAPLLVLGAARVGTPLRYRLYLEDVILPEEVEDLEDPVHAILHRYSRAMERMVSRHPEQYFWLHRRWKSEPRVRARQPDRLAA